MNAPPKLRAAILAAGQGTRLRAAGALKPLVQVRGQPLITHVLAGFAEAGAAEATIIVNEASTAVRDSLQADPPPLPVRWLVETTPSSMHSFLRLVETLAAEGDAGPFLLSTVDTVLPRGAAADFWRRACACRGDVVLAINHPAEDDNPLWVQCAPDSTRVTALGEKAAGSAFATAGLYLVRPAILAEAEAARRDGVSSLRQFLGRLLAGGFRFEALEIANSIDVDQPRDIIAAEKLMTESCP